MAFSIWSVSTSNAKCTSNVDTRHSIIIPLEICLSTRVTE